MPERAAEVWADNMQDWLREKHAVPHSQVFTGRQGLSWKVGVQNSQIPHLCLSNIPEEEIEETLDKQEDNF